MNENPYKYFSSLYLKHKERKFGNGGEPEGWGEGNVGLTYLSGNVNNSPFTDGGGVDVYAPAPSWIKKKDGTLLSQTDARVVNDIRQRKDYQGLSKFALGAAMSPLLLMNVPILAKGAESLSDAYSAWSLAHPLAGSALSLGNYGLAGYSLTSPDGVKKTYNLAKKGDYKGAMLSGLGDAVDAASLGNFGSSIVRSLPWRVWGSGVSSAASGTAQLARNSVSNIYNAYKAYHPMIPSGIPWYMRPKAETNFLHNIWNKEGTFLRDMRIYNPLQNVSGAFSTPIDKSFLLKNHLFDDYRFDVIDGTNNVFQFYDIGRNVYDSINN
jgi:hypothetical protein